MRWIIDLMTNCGGHFEGFFTKESALKYAYDNWDYPYITLEHNSKRIRIKDNPEGKQGDKNCRHHWIGEFGHVRCEKCNAVLNIACNHTGSVGCTTCANTFAEELDSGKQKKPELYNTVENICKICGLKNDADGNCINEYCKSKLVG